MSPTGKATEWVGSSKKDLKAMPAEVQGEIGYALHVAQEGNRASNAKPLKGFPGISVMEVTADFATDTYRGVYTVRFARAIYVLHCFQKKSKRGIEMTQSDKDLIRRRLQAAEIDYHKKYGRQEDV
jgi:phage-related protein